MGKNIKRRGLAISLTLALLLGLIVPGNVSVVSAENISEKGELASTIPGNILQNPEFDNNDFGQTIGYFKWYPNASNISQNSTYSFASGKSMMVSNRTATSSRAEYREWFGNLAFDKEYYLQGAVASSWGTEVELVVDVIGYGGSAGNEYPTVTLSMDTGRVAKNKWTVLSGSIKFTSEPSKTEGKIDVTVHFNGTTQIIQGVTGLDCIQLSVQETYYVDSEYPDLYLDSFLLKEGGAPHDDGENTEENTANKIVNSSFETNDFGIGHQYFKWYPTPGTTTTITQTNNYSHSGRYSLRVSNRLQASDRAQYREWFGNLGYGTKYEFSGYVSATSATPVELVAVVWGYGGPTGNEYPSTVMTLAYGTATSVDWTKLAGTFTISSTPSSTSDKKDVKVSWGEQSQTMAAITDVDCIEFFVQEQASATTHPDLFLDSFALEPATGGEVVKNYPSGHQNASNTEEATNLINNSSFETDDFGLEHNFEKWYKTSDSTAVLSQFADASHSGSHSLRVSNRTVHWNRAQYRVAGSQIVPDRLYNLSGYVCAQYDTTVELMIEVMGYGGVTDPYPGQYMAVDSVAANISDWVKVESEFSIAKTPNSTYPDKFDLTVSCGDQTVTIEAVDGLSAVQIYVQEPYYSGTICPDLYLDSFLLQDVTPEIERPSGHTGATDTSKDTGNIINNGGFEQQDFATSLVSDKWYADPATVTMVKDSTFSHSGSASLCIQNRIAHWNRASYQISSEKIALGHTYVLSGYVSATENIDAELMVEVFAYVGPENNRTYPSRLITFDSKHIERGQWGFLSGEITITQVETETEGVYDLVISWSGGDDFVLEDVNGLSGIRIMPQEAYSAATPRPDLYLDSFLFKDMTPKTPAPTGHSNQENTELLSDNLIKNGSFEADDFVHQQYGNEQWYTAADCPATLIQDTTYSHSGKASLKVSNRDQFWHRAEYRVDGSNIIRGHAYEVSGYVSSAYNMNAEMYLQVWAFGGPSSEPYPSQLISVDKAVVPAGEWTKLSTLLTITAQKSSEEGYYDYIIMVSGSTETYKLTHVQGISNVQIMVQEAYHEATPRADMYLDSFVMRDTTPNSSLSVPTGHTGAADTEDIDGNLINNSSFEAELYNDSVCSGMWFKNANNFDVQQVTQYSHSGEASMRVYNRKAANHTLIYRVDGSNLKVNAEYTLSGYVAAAQKTEARLMLTVYGYAGNEDNRTFPSKTVMLSCKDVKDWTELSSVFKINYENEHLYLETISGKVDIGNCLGLSCVELYVITDETAQNYTTDLYFDSFSFVLGAVTQANEDVSTIVVKDYTEKTEDSSRLQTYDVAKQDTNALGANQVLYIALIVGGIIVILGSAAITVYVTKKPRKKDEL